VKACGGMLDSTYYLFLDEQSTAQISKETKHLSKRLA
jgi:hypothetical protein